MAGSVDIVTRCWPGLDVRDDVLWLNPLLPSELQSVNFGVTFRGHRIDLEIDNERVCLRSRSPAAEPVHVGIGGQVVALAAGEELTLAGTGPA